MWGYHRVTIQLHRFLGVPLTVAVMALAGCQSTNDDVTPSAAASATASAVASIEPSVGTSASPTDTTTGTETSVFDLEVGDCFSADGDAIESVLVVDCDQPHVYEAFSVFDHEGGPDEPYPGDQAILEYADDACQPSFEAFVDFDYETSIWYITSVTPSTETWAEGDREIICTLDQQDSNGEPIEVTGSAEGAAE